MLRHEEEWPRKETRAKGEYLGAYHFPLSQKQLLAAVLRDRASCKMRLKDLEIALTGLDTFEDPKYELEQYPTSAHLASRLLYTAHQKYDDIEGRAVLDLGCGPGMLTMAAELLGSAYTVGVDIDPDALRIAQSNCEELGAEATFCRGDILDEQAGFLKDLHVFDTVLMNPPFGTRRKGADVGFLQAGLRLTKNALYSLHKSSTREFLQRKATQEWGVSFELVAELRFDIPHMYKFHRKKSADVKVDLIRLCHIAKPMPSPVWPIGAAEAAPEPPAVPDETPKEEQLKEDPKEEDTNREETATVSAPSVKEGALSTPTASTHNQATLRDSVQQTDDGSVRASGESGAP